MEEQALSADSGWPGGARSTYGYRLYRGPLFCKLECGLFAEWVAREAIDEALASVWYDRAEITRDGVVIEELKK